MTSLPESTPAHSAPLALTAPVAPLCRAQLLVARDMLAELNIERGLDALQVAAARNVRVLIDEPVDVTLPLLRTLNASLDEKHAHVGLDAREVALWGDVRRALGITTGIRSTINFDGTLGRVR